MKGADAPMALPIEAYRHDIVETVRQNAVTVVIAETGSGKTTQISQFLHAAGLTADGMVGVTQPRRVAAVTVAQRVAQEMGGKCGTTVGYTVRFEDRTCPATKIKYLTDGCLMRECLEDAQLRKYSVLILDEAHERSLDTDVLFGLVKQISKSRSPPLKLVVTSATLDGEKFSSYFDNCPVLNVPGRCFPVSIAHTAELPKSWTEECVNLCLDIHLDQPKGDVLGRRAKEPRGAIKLPVFLTGQDEIEKCVRALTDRVRSLPAGEAGDLQVLPLYASLPPEMQVRVFAPPPEGCRRVVFATNIAETSLTVPGIVYVVDPGHVKQKQYNPATGMDTLKVTLISQTQATQRAGRAGRTQAGRCFRLYPKSTFDRDMTHAQIPELQRSSLVGTVLHLKTLSLPIDVLTFDFLDPPSVEALEDALRQLYVLEAIDLDGKVTEMGRRMSLLPLDPSLARAMIEAERLGCVEEMCVVSAMLSAERIFIPQGRPPPGERQQNNFGGIPPAVLAMDKERLGDHVLLMRIFECWAQNNYSAQFCHDHSLQLRGMNFAKDVHRQLTQISRKLQHDGGRGGGGGGGGDTGSNDRGDRHRSQGSMQERGDRQDRKDKHRSRSRSRSRERHKKDKKDRHRSRSRSRSRERRRSPPPRPARGPESSAPDEGLPRRLELRAVRHALAVGFGNRLARRMLSHNGYKTYNDQATLAQLHPASTHMRADAEGLYPEWVIYHELVTTSRPFLRQVCAVEMEWIEPIVPRLRGVDTARLSGRKQRELEEKAKAGQKVAGQALQLPSASTPVAAAAETPKLTGKAAADEARARYLERKKAAAARK